MYIYIYIYIYTVHTQIYARAHMFQIKRPTPCQGISYCPVPVKSVMSLKSDDWMTDLAKPLWSAAGRGDLEVMHSLGANAVARQRHGSWDLFLGFARPEA